MGTTSADTRSSELQHIERLVQTKLPGSPIYAFLLSSVRITEASSGRVVARLALTQDHMNSMGSLHGSVTATIIDWMGGMAIATFDIRENTGVSVDIHVTYQSGAKVGEEIEIEGIAEKVGGSLAFTKIGLYKVDAAGARGKIVATGTHTKFVRGTAPSKP